MSSPLFDKFAAQVGLPDNPSLRQLVNSVQAIPYGRPRSRTAEGVLEDWQGTCSTKHALLVQLIDELLPDARPHLVHRVYQADRAAVLERHGTVAADAIPEGGLADVHRYLVIELNGRHVSLDITFPGDPPWDGFESMPLACGEGQDFPAGQDPDADKAALEAEYCDPQAREPFIAALSRASQAH